MEGKGTLCKWPKEETFSVSKSSHAELLGHLNVGRRYGYGLHKNIAQKGTFRILNSRYVLKTLTVP